ncbi:TetR family transcriptional regulator [Mycobacterium tuberculosis]|uniref:TetR family transcriptional regulator n=1 Tax=Mycobacterium tuberculosis TaxID=1773 RepID=A0A655AS07_MYCTX|nr:TetR family transcriptional regulator [Mycobacterium tuberculosis]
MFALEMAFFGALVQAGSGTFTYHEIIDSGTWWA